MTEPALEFVDAHHHLWDLRALRYPWLMARGERRFFGDPTPIQHDYLVLNYLNESARYRPQRSVHIQVGVAPGEELLESQWLQQLPDFPHAIVAFCDLASPTVAADLEAQMRFSKLRGVRQIVGRHLEEDRKHGSDALLDDPAWLEGLRLLAHRDLSFDLQLIPQQMERAYAVLKAAPDLRVALCHCGSPWHQDAAGLEHWRKGLRRLAALPNVACKVSGLGMFNPQWQAEDLRPLILEVIDTFGPERTMFGSNFPVDKLYNTYDALWGSYDTITAGFSDAERRQLFVETASRFYPL